MNDKPKKIEDLEQKAWFRFLKVIYIGTFVLASLFVILITSISEESSKGGTFL